MSKLGQLVTTGRPFFWRGMGILSLFGCLQGALASQFIEIPYDYTIKTPKWKSYEGVEIKPHKKSLEAQLYTAKDMFLKAKYKMCVQQLKKVQKRGHEIGPWIAYWELKCLLEDKKQNSSFKKSLQQVVKKITEKPLWLHEGQAKNKLLPLFLRAKMLLFELQIVKSRKAAWKTFSNLSDWQDKFNSDTSAQFYKLAGNLAFSQQKFDQAKSFFVLSLQYKKSEKVIKKLKSFTKVSVNEIFQFRADGKKNKKWENGSDKEMQLYRRMQKELVAGDMVSSVEDGMDLIQKFPWSQRSKWAAKRVIEIYLKLLRKKQDKLFRVEEKILNAMKPASELQLNQWAQRLIRKKYFSATRDLLKDSFERPKASDIRLKNLELAAQACVFIGDYELAETLLKSLIQEASGRLEKSLATYRLGHLMYRWKKYPKSVEAFESYLSGSEGGEYEVEARYWLWRSLKHLGETRASDVAIEIHKKFPLHLYGLLAGADANNNLVAWPEELKKYIANKKTLKIWVSEAQQQAWKRFKVLVGAGWFGPAREELGSLPQSNSVFDKLVFAKLWALAKGFQKSAKVFYEAWHWDPTSLSLDSINTIYPKEFRQVVEKEATRNKLDPNLIYALIKQESSFDPDAISPSRAMGLMQLMPGTAREVAKNLRWKNFEINKQPFQPKVNIRLGARYLKRMIRAFNGHVPLALAAYNVGIGNMRKWLRARPALESLTNSERLSGTWEDVWVEELPWAETTGYVKSVLRNYLIYNLIDGSSVDISQIWWQNQSKLNQLSTSKLDR